MNGSSSMGMSIAFAITYCWMSSQYVVSVAGLLDDAASAAHLSRTGLSIRDRFRPPVLAVGMPAESKKSAMIVGEAVMKDVAVMPYRPESVSAMAEVPVRLVMVSSMPAAFRYACT